MDKLVKIAISQCSQKEIKGEQYNMAIINCAKEAGFAWGNDDETQWRGFFINWGAQKAQPKGSGKSNVRSWLLAGLTGSNPLDTLLDIRQLKQSTIAPLPTESLKLGDKDDSVKDLQKVYKIAGFDSGTSDGDYGNTVMNTVKALQANSGELTVNGLFGNQTQKYLLEIQQS